MVTTDADVQAERERVEELRAQLAFEQARSREAVRDAVAAAEVTALAAESVRLQASITRISADTALQVAQITGRTEGGKPTYTVPAIPSLPVVPAIPSSSAAASDEPAPSAPESPAAPIASQE